MSCEKQAASLSSLRPREVEEGEPGNEVGEHESLTTAHARNCVERFFYKAPGNVPSSQSFLWLSGKNGDHGRDQETLWSQLISIS